MDDEYESFDVNDRDVEYALNPGKYRRQTKDQQIYGIWAPQEDEDDVNERPAFGKKPANYAAPVQFISGGVKVGNKMENEDVEPAPGPSSANDDDIAEVPVIPEKRQKRSGFSAGVRRDEAFAGMRAGGPLGTWTQTSGKSSVIMNMMKKMGYEHGKGLGQNKQGIVEPVEAVVRKGRGAVGAYGNETKGLNFGESAGDAQRRDDTDDVEIVEVEEMRINAWKKTHIRRVKPKYTTLEDVIKETVDYDKPKLSQNVGKIIDMTGPQHKVYDSFQSFQQRSEIDKRARRPHYDVPALTENLDHLILSCKNEIRLNNDHLVELKNKTMGMKRDHYELEQSIVETKKSLNRLDTIADLVKRCEKIPRNNLETCLDQFYEIISELRTEFPLEYNQYALDSVVEFKILPVFKDYFRLWAPLDTESVEFGYAQLKKWKTLLTYGKTNVFEHNRLDPEAATVFDSILWNAWMPTIRRAVVQWDPRLKSPQMIHFVAIWMPILPNWIHEDLLDNVIVPRIRERVEEWDPVSDEIAIETWLIPWHEVLGDRLLHVYPQIRQKLAKALRNWNPTDLSAIGVISPWKPVFSKSTMSGFLSTNIVPKLQEALRTMNMNPTENTEYNEFYAVLEWKDLLGDELTCAILTKSFFSRWYENLCMWLEVPGAVPDVMTYYKEWSERVPEEVRRLAPIKSEFTRALIAIRSAKQSIPIEKMPNFTEIQAAAHAFIPATVQPQPAFVNSQPISFRSIVEHRAKELGVVFAPQPNRYHNGRAVYWFGDKSIYIDGTALVAYDNVNRIWSPISLEHLITLM